MQMASTVQDPALSRGERSASHSVRLGGRDVSAQVESWSLDSSYATDLPDAMRAFSGSSSTQLALSVTGVGGRSAPALYGPWAPRASGDVARPGQSVVAGWGLNGAAGGVFRGTVRSRSAESGTDLVRLNALDGAERLRQPAHLPRPDTAYASGQGWGDWVASPVWAVDHLLRSAGIDTAPPPRPTSILHASFHGGAAAGVGTLESLNSGWSFWAKRDAPFESGILGNFSSPSMAHYVPALLPVTRRSDGLWYEVWTNTSTDYGFAARVEFQSTWEASAGAATWYTAMHFNFADGSITAYCGTNADVTRNPSRAWTWTTLKDRTRLHIGMWLTFSETGVPSFVPVVTKDGSPQALTAGSFPSSPLPAGTMANTTIGVQSCHAESFQLSQHATRPTTREQVTQEGTWKRTASLDTPVFPLRSIPNVSGSAWDVITEIARATLATAEFDSDGFFRWRNHTRWATVPTEPDVVVTSARALGALTVTEEIDACRNHCTVRWESWQRVTHTAPSVIRDGPAPLAILAGGTLTRTIWVDDNMLDPRAPRTAATDGAGSPNRLSIRSTTAATSTAVLGAVEVRVTRAGGIVTLTMRNRSASTVFYHGATLIALTPSEDNKPVPSLWSAWNTSSQARYGVQTYEHDVKGWVQENASGQALAEALRNAGAFPPPLLQQVEILPDYRIRLGSVVRVVDRTGAQLDTLAWVIGIKTTGGGGRITQTLTLRGTATNGLPTDTGLTPDPPTRPYAPAPI